MDAPSSPGTVTQVSSISLGGSNRSGLGRTFGVVLACALALGALSTLARRLLVPGRELPVLVTLPAFTLTSQEGRPFGSAELIGHPYVADFVFTRCPTICPRLTERMLDVQRKTGASLKLVSFSVDPTYDTPQRLKGYAGTHHADTSRWTFLTGSIDGMKTTIVQGFKVSMGREGPEDDFLSIFHGNQLVLVDGKGQVRGYYDSQDAEAMSQLFADARELLNP